MAGYEKRRYFTEDELRYRVKVLLSHHYTEEEIANDLDISICKVRQLMEQLAFEQYLLA